VPLKISFSERLVYRAPLEVLQHLYYYTTQYGLSVAQFTGAHQKYWERLPAQLKKAQNSPEKMNSIIKELEVFAAGAKKRLLKRREQKDKGWAEKEIVLNSQLLSVLAAFPSELLANGFKELIHYNLIMPSMFVHSNGIFAVAIIILALSALNGLLTLYLMSSGAKEMNPFMSYLIDFNPRIYLAVKCIITTAAIIFLIVMRNYKSKLLGIRISKLLTTTALVFFVIIAYQLYMILY